MVQICATDLPFIGIRCLLEQYLTIFSLSQNQPEQVLPVIFDTVCSKKKAFYSSARFCQGWQLPFCLAIGRSQPKTVLPPTLPLGVDFEPKLSLSQVTSTIEPVNLPVTSVTSKQHEPKVEMGQ